MSCAAELQVCAPVAETLRYVVHHCLALVQGGRPAL